jgi:histone H4
MAPARKMKSAANKRKKGRRNVLGLAYEGQNFVGRGDIRRLVRRGGVRRLSRDVYPEVADCILNFLNQMVKDSLAFTTHCRRKTVLVKDVIFAAKRHRRQFIGFMDK